MTALEQIVLILLMALAVWRVSCIITSEEFVFGLAQKLRLKLGVVQDKPTVEVVSSSNDDGEPIYETIFLIVDRASHLQPTRLARGITCLYCTSFWLGLACGGAYMAVYGVSFMSLCLPFALSALAIGFDEVIG